MRLHSNDAVRNNLNTPKARSHSDAHFGECVVACGTYNMLILRPISCRRLKYLWYYRPSFHTSGILLPTTTPLDRLAWRHDRLLWLTCPTLPPSMCDPKIRRQLIVNGKHAHKHRVVGKLTNRILLFWREADVIDRSSMTWEFVQ